MLFNMLNTVFEFLQGINTLQFNSLFYLIFYTNMILSVCTINFMFNFNRPFILILLLEIMYLALNMNFLFYYLLNGFEYGASYVIICLSISAAETIIGTTLVLKFYHFKPYEASFPTLFK